MRLEGTCHCGNIAVVLETEQDPTALPLRACDCSFCRRHGARTTSDPQGRARVGIQDRKLVSHYVFGLRTSEMIVCARCGMYCAAVYREGERGWAVLNANVFLHPAFDRLPQVVSYEGETAEARIGRRKRMWTPLFDLDVAPTESATTGRRSPDPRRRPSRRVRAPARRQR